MPNFRLTTLSTVLLLAMAASLISACQKDKVNNDMTIKQIQVAPQLVDCVGVGPMKCMKIKEQDQDWQLFYSSIEGFQFEPGYQYQLEVKVTEKQQPIPADASSRQWTLVKVINKQKVAN